MRIDAPMESVVKQAGNCESSFSGDVGRNIDASEFGQGLWVKESIR